MKDDRFDYYEQEQYINGHLYKENELTDAERKKLKKRGVIGIILMVVGFILFLSNFFVGSIFGGIENGHILMIYMPISGIGGMILIAIGSFLSRPILQQKVANYQKKVNLYSKNELSELSDVNAEIGENATRRTAKAFKEGINDAESSNSSAQKFCSQSGGKISKSSKFCSHCGAEQN